jgi:hypothetical protein
VRLNHINLCSSNVIKLANDLVTFFDFRLIDNGAFASRAGSVGEQEFATVIAKDGFAIVITNIEPMPDGCSAYPDGFHFGLIQETREAVFDKHAELISAGVTPGPINDGFEIWGATWTTFYSPLGDGLQIEINYRTPSALLDEKAPDAN